MVILGNYFSAILFFAVQILFSISIFFNQLGLYSIAKVIILLSTNYAVLTLNFTYGYDAGFYLYYFSTPLVVFSFFHFHQWRQTVISLALYLSSYVIAEISGYKDIEPFMEVDDQVLKYLYYVNAILSFCFLIVLARSFSKFHKNASEQVQMQNKELNKNQVVLQRLLEDKSTLLSETHHRVKNNLAVISGMFDLQIMNEKNAEINSVFINAKNRIKSMSLIHESLYKQSTVSQIDFKKYILTLINELKSSLQTNKKVNFTVQIDPFSLDLSRAIPCGLIINEVITNSFKHAFASVDQPEIFIKMTYTDHFRLAIGDNGVGMSETTLSTKNSIGMSLIDALTKQLNGTLEIENKIGTHFIIQFE